MIVSALLRSALLWSSTVIRTIDDVGLYSYGPIHPMKPHRMRMAHQLVSSYGMLEKMEVIVRLSPRRHRTHNAVQLIPSGPAHSDLQERRASRWRAFIQTSTSTSSTELRQRLFRK